MFLSMSAKCHIAVRPRPLIVSHRWNKLLACGCSPPSEIAGQEQRDVATQLWSVASAWQPWSPDLARSRHELQRDFEPFASLVESDGKVDRPTRLGAGHEPIRQGGKRENKSICIHWSDCSICCPQHCLGGVGSAAALQVD